MSESQLSQSQPITQDDIDEITARKYIKQSLAPGALSTRLQVISENILYYF